MRFSLTIPSSLCSDLPHRHVFGRFGRDVLNGNRTEVVVTFFCDERDRCESCGSLDSGVDEEFTFCRREHPDVYEAIERASASYEENPNARPWERWACTVTDRDISVRREGETQDDALRSAYYGLRNELEWRLGVPCGRRLCTRCHVEHQCQNEQETT